jgi:hypothetical protein
VRDVESHERAKQWSRYALVEQDPHLSRCSLRDEERVPEFERSDGLLSRY